MASSYRHCLIADIGGTYSRIAIVDRDGAMQLLMQVENDTYPDLHTTLADYISKLPLALKPVGAVIAVACPVTGDRVSLTNRDWSFSISGYRSSLGLDFLHVINDFAAIALAISSLTPDDYISIGQGEVAADKPIGIIGPGTGLGVSFLVPDHGRWIPVNSEGGHVTLAAADEMEEQIIALVRRQHGHVSAESLLSGPGLSVLYRAISELGGRNLTPPPPNEIIIRDEQRNDPIASQSIDMFLAMLGTVAANLAVTISAEGGIYFAGGILPRLRQRMVNSQFRERFITHDVYRNWLERIPTRLIIKKHVALEGLREYLQKHE